MNFVLENWYLILTCLVLVVVGGLTCLDFVKLPRKTQIETVKQWLLFAVLKAEEQLGSGTGQLKVRQVYDWFIERFPAIAGAVSFDMFCMWVDEALEQMETLLDTDATVANVILQNEVK